MTRVALVTGATGGIGGPMVDALLGAGYAVVVSGTNRAALEARMAGAAGQWRCVAGDLSSTAGAEQLARDAEAAFGRIDILVNNAGISNNALPPRADTGPVKFWTI